MKPSSLNHTFRLVWSDTLGAYVPVPETVSARGKRSRSARGLSAALAIAGLVGIALPAAAAPPAANALPTGGQVTSGSATISQSGNTLNINQSTQKMIANWGSFDIGKDAKVNFNQPDANSQALNRITGQNPSQIFGQLNANGQVVLINPNGIVFGQGSQVNVGGLVASTLQLSDADFHNGQLRFTAGNGAGSIVNQGSLNGQVVALIAPQVSNQGSIVANNGSAVLASGNQVTLDFSGNGSVNVKVDEGTFNALVENKALIQADGGMVVMTAKTADTLMATVVNNEGTIQARTLDNKSGRILLLGDMQNGRGEFSGTLDASAPNGGDGGFVETSAAQVKIANGIKVTTTSAQGQSGTWLIDPTDFTIRSGTDAQSTTGIGASTLQTALGNGNVTITTDAGGTGNGDILINAPISWSANTLTLNAESTAGNINIDALVTASGTAGLALNPGTTGAIYAGMNVNTSSVFTGRVEMSGSAGLTISGQTYTVIRDATALQNINSALTGKYVLGTNIDLNNAAFTPIGVITPLTQASATTEFTGKFNGLGNVISNLKVTGPDATTTSSPLGAGLFGGVKNASIQNVGLVNVDVVQSALAASDGNTNFRNSKSVGALIGTYRNLGTTATLSNLFVTGTGAVKGENQVGGLIGYIQNEDFQGNATTTVKNVFSTIAIQAIQPTTSSNFKNAAFIGGLIGNVNAPQQNNSYQSIFELSNSFATGNITGLTQAVNSNNTTHVGGLVGVLNTMNPADVIRLNNVYATGNVQLGTGTVTYAGGLAGRAVAATITNAYAAGAVSDAINNGGLLGQNSTSSITDSFYHTTVNAGLKGIAGTNDVAGSVYGLSTAELKLKANYTSSTTANGSNAAAWDFDQASGRWGFKATKNSDYPVLCYFYGGACAIKVAVTLADTSKTYGDANPTLPSYTADTSVLQSGDTLNNIAWGTAATTGMDAGTYVYRTTDLLAPNFTFVSG